MRTATPSPFLPTVIQLMTDAREAVAADLFNIEAVRLAITKAAASGKARLFLRPPLPLNIQKTKASKALTEYLTGIGLATFWHSYTVEDGGRPETGYELEVSWHGRE